MGAVAILLPAGLLLLSGGSPSAGKYRELAVLPSREQFDLAVAADEFSLLTVVFSITALIMLSQWQSLFPARRDYLALAGLPIRASQIFVARFATVMLLSAGLVIVMNIVPSIIAPLEFGGRWMQGSSFWAGAAAQAAALGGGCLFVLLGIVAAQGLLLNILSPELFERLSVYLQGALISVFVVAGLFGWSVREWPPAAFLICMRTVFGCRRFGLRDCNKLCWGMQHLSFTRWPSKQGWASPPRCCARSFSTCSATGVSARF
jgi:hypothetical protein